jgi:hypothetical protein
MSDAEFAAFMAQLEDEHFSSGRLALIQMVARDNYFTSAQTRAVVSSLHFSSSRVESAVLMYPRVVDQDNFYQIFSAFTFQMPKEEVRRRLAI